MQLTEKQELGLKTIVKRYRDKEKYTVISGYAGTGKSTLVKFAISALDLPSEQIAYATFTGKAAEVLRKKGNPGACTLHKLLYEHIPLPNGKFLRKPRPALDVSVVVVDEVSMAPKSMMDLLFKHNVYVICLGDPFQLPQIDSKEENGLLQKPHVFLDEIMRQAAESEIIQTTMKIRAMQPLELTKGNEVQIFNRSELNTGMLTWADQILVATNAMRISVNNQVRGLLGYEGNPQEGERLVCLRNYWDDVNEAGDVLTNGTTGIISKPRRISIPIPRFIHSSVSQLESVQCGFTPDGGKLFEDIQMDNKMIMTGEKCIDYKLAYRLGQLKDKIGDIVPKEFAFAYAMTIWKAQGSEWDNVLLLEESFPFDKLTHYRALYTGCTRAAKKLVVIKR